MEIMDELITNLSRKIIKEKRKIILVFDNVSSYLPDLVDPFSSVKAVILPVNTACRLQPLDAGVIKKFKVPTGDSFSHIPNQESVSILMRTHQLFVSLWVCYMRFGG